MQKFRILATALAAASLASGASLAAGRTPTGGPPVMAADVVLFIDEAPCAEPVTVAEIAVQQEPMALADVLRALRLEAAHRGANAVMDIKVAPGPEGRFRVSGVAIRCAQAAPPAQGPDAPPNATPMPAPPGDMPRPRGLPGPRGSVEPPASAATTAASAVDGIDARVASFLGPNFIAVLSGADKIESFHLSGRGAGEPAVQSFAVVGKGRDLSPAQIARLRALILDRESYLFDRSKRCPFIANVAFVLHRSGERASVAIASQCNLWSFAPAGARESAIEDFDPAAPAVKALVAEVLGS